MTAVTVAKQPDPRALLDPRNASPQWLKSSLNGMSDEYKPSIPEDVAPTEEQRQIIQLTISRLEEHFQPASDDQIATAFALLQAAFPAAKLQDGEARANAMAYMIGLEGVPAFALDEAVRQVLRGSAGLNKAFMPTPPELRGLVNRASAPAFRHRYDLQRLLRARVERRVSAGPRDLPEAVKAFMAFPFQSENTGAA